MPVLTNWQKKFFLKVFFEGRLPWFPYDRTCIPNVLTDSGWHAIFNIYVESLDNHVTFVRDGLTHSHMNFFLLQAYSSHVLYMRYFSFLSYNFLVSFSCLESDDRNDYLHRLSSALCLAVYSIFSTFLLFARSFLAIALHVRRVLMKFLSFLSAKSYN